MNYLLEKLEECPRCGASGPDWGYDIQRCKCMEPKSILASIDLPLRNCVEIKDGWVSFCYPYRVGAYISNTRHALKLVQAAKSCVSAKSRKAAINFAEDHLLSVIAEDELIHKQWDDYCEARRIDMEARRAVSR
jgi:hypothetical protein